MLTILEENASNELLAILANLDLQAQNISDVSELFAYLLNQVQDINLDESQVYNAFLDLVDNVEKEKVLEELLITELPPEPETRGFIYWGAGASILLILMLVLYFRRRNKVDSNSPSI